MPSDIHLKDDNIIRDYITEDNLYVSSTMPESRALVCFGSMNYCRQMYLWVSSLGLFNNHGLNI